MRSGLDCRSYLSKLTLERKERRKKDIEIGTEMTFFSGNRTSYWTDLRTEEIRKSKSVSEIKQILATPYHDFNWQIIFDAFPFEQSVADHLRSLPHHIQEEFWLIRTIIQYLSEEEYEKYDITIARISSYLKNSGMCPYPYDADEMSRAFIFLNQKFFPARNPFEQFRNIKAAFGKDDYFFYVKNASSLIDEEFLKFKVMICKISGNSISFLNKEKVDIQDIWNISAFIKNGLDCIFYSLNKENLDLRYTFEFVGNCKTSIREYSDSREMIPSLYLSISGLYLAQARFGNIFLDAKELLLLDSLKQRCIEYFYHSENLNSYIESLKKIQKTQNELALRTFLFSIQHTQQPSVLEAGFGAISDLAAIVAEYSYKKEIAV